MYTFLDIDVIYLYILFFSFLTNLSVKTNFPALCVEYISIPLPSNQGLTDILENPLPLLTHILFGFRPDSFEIV